MIYKNYLINVFSGEMFAGYKVVVSLLKRAVDETLLKKLAEEMAWPVSAFVLPQDDNFLLRFFTAEGELNTADQALIAVAHVLRQAGLWPSGKTVSLLSRAGRHDLSFNPGTGEMGLLLNSARNEKIEATEAAALITAMGLQGEEVFAVEKSGHLVFIYCRDRLSRHKVGWQSETWPQSGVLKNITGAAVSAAVDNLELPGFEISFVPVLAEQPGSDSPDKDGAPARLGVCQAEYNLSFWAAAAFFWSGKLAAGKLALQLHNYRSARLTATFLEEKRGIIIGGQVKTIFKADPAAPELIFERDTAPSKP